MATFSVELIEPSLYDPEGYVIQWVRSFSVSNSLGCLHALSLDAARRQVLGEDVEIDVRLHDEHHKVVPIRRIARRIRANGGAGLVCLVGVQSNQYPRALDIARQFRERGVKVAIGGFHVSGSLSMLPEPPPDLQEALDLGVTLFAGEAEGKLDELLQDAYHDRLRPIYDHLKELPHLEGAPLPALPMELIEKTVSSDIPFDSSRGCPFNCSFCTIINVQGRRSRSRTADDVEKIILNYEKTKHRMKNNFFISDDNFARNGNWEEILDRIYELNQREGARIRFGIQIDTQAHKIPNFVEKAARAGCNAVFIGLESINPASLKAAGKPQNKVGAYRDMLLTWRSKSIVTMAGYILGFPGDTAETIRRDIKTIQRDLPIDMLLFTALTPLPGSADHKRMFEAGEWMDPDLNNYDCSHITQNHEVMSREEWEAIYRDAWSLYYSDEHVRTILKRGLEDGISMSKLIGRVVIGHCSTRYEGVHPYQCGAIRRKIRKQRRPGLGIEPVWRFYPRRAAEVVRSLGAIGGYTLKVTWWARRFKRQRAAAAQRLDAAGAGP